MKQLRFAILLAAAALGIVRAQEEERRAAPPTDIPDFSNLDEYIYVPKSTVTLGFRHLSGAKTHFSGQGKIVAPIDSGPATGANLARTYHDGAVFPDTRTLTRRDAGGNPLIDTETNALLVDPIAPDGKTNTWNYLDSRQVTESGYLALHNYSAEVIDTGIRSRNAISGFGMELAVRRDMGNLRGSRLTWHLSAGVALNDISSGTIGTVRANLLTQTDFYSLFGQTPPAGPYSAPSSTSVNLLDAAGNTIPITQSSDPQLDEFGNPTVDTTITNATISADSTVLMGNEPLGRMNSVATDETSVSNHWRVKGAYFTFRAGPTVMWPITTRLRASFSVGAALVYSGTNYTVTQTFQPEIGEQVQDTSTSSAYRLLPGYFADASLQFDLTERSGFFAGAVFQSAGSYTQRLDNATAHYATKIDLSNQDGLRAGMSIRF